MRKIISKYSLIFLVIILLLHSVILSKLIFFPYPEFFIYPYLTNQGLVPYQQIFDQHFPGLMFLPVNFDNLGMTTAEISRRWLIVVVLLTQLLIFFVTKKITKSSNQALVASFLYLIWQPFLEGWTFWIDSIAPLFLLPAFYLSYLYLTKKRLTDIFWSGFFLSIAVMFKQVFIPLYILLGLLILFKERSFRPIFFYFLGFLPITFLWVGYFYLRGVFGDLFFWTVTFNLTTFAKEGSKAPFLSGLIRVIWIYLPVAVIFVLKDKIFVLLMAVFLIGSLSGDLSRFDLVHFQPSLPFVVITTTILVFQMIKMLATKIYLSIYVLVAVIWLITFFKGHISDKVFFFDNQTQAISQVIRNNSIPGEEIFILGPVPHLYQMTATIPVGRIFVFQFPWFLQESEDRFLEALENGKPNLIVRDNSVIIEGRPITKFAAKLNEYIDKN